MIDYSLAPTPIAHNEYVRETAMYLRTHLVKNGNHVYIRLFGDTVCGLGQISQFYSESLTYARTQGPH